MRIFDVNDNELREEDIDLEAGYLTPDRKFKEHHDAIEGQERQAHYTVSAFYFEDGTKYEPVSEDDEHIHIDDAEKGLFAYNDVEELGKKLRGIDLKEVEDAPAITGQDAWDEYEDIQIYREYTEEELEQREAEKEAERKREEFMSTGLERIASLETQAETLSGDIETVGEGLEETNVTVEDLVLIMADLLAGEEEVVEEPAASEEPIEE